MAEIKNLERLVGKLRAMAAAAAKDQGSVVVGYTAGYALWVHENREMKWKGKPRRSGIGAYWGPAGRAGFLLDVAREMQKEIVGIVKQGYSKTKQLIQSLLLGGLRLQRESTRNVPAEYGNLRATAFTRVEQ